MKWKSFLLVLFLLVQGMKVKIKKHNLNGACFLFSLHCKACAGGVIDQPNRETWAGGVCLHVAIEWTQHEYHRYKKREGEREREGGLFSGSTTSTNGMCSALLSVGWMRWCVPLEGVIKPHLRLAHGVDPCPITSLFFLSFRISIFNTFSHICLRRRPATFGRMGK